MTLPWDVRYARTVDGIDVAYTTSGDGPRDVVLIHGFTTHLDFVGDSPWHAYWTRRLGERSRVIQLDKRGTGLSDRTLGHGSIEDRMRDVLAVMDMTGSSRASIVGISEGGPIALAFAATYPERVDKLVLYGTFAADHVGARPSRGGRLGGGRAVWCMGGGGVGQRRGHGHVLPHPRA